VVGRRKRLTAVATDESTFGPRTADRPPPVDGSRNLVVVVLDSLRYDVCKAARMPNLARLGSITQRWSYASWTAPSHYNLLMGLMPHHSPTHVFASEHYKKDFARYDERLAVKDIAFADFLPQLSLPGFLRSTLGYRTTAMVSMPVLNPSTPINFGFDDFELMPVHNDMAAMVDLLSFTPERPTFTLLNVGETHYPYATPGEDSSNWPVISGLHGVVKHLDDTPPPGAAAATDTTFFTAAEMDQLRDRQVAAAEHCDAVLGRLYDALPNDTWVIVLADHGELFGEDGYFGHGPVAHEKVLEVPFVEGVVPR
jgi:sulfatase-like protein